MHAALGTGANGPFFYWNVDTPVGLNGTNKEDDVLFVQWCLYKMARWDHVKPETRAILAKTPINGRCTGRDGDELITSIKALQRMVGTVMVDGRVSPVRAGGTYRHQGVDRLFLIFALNNALRMMYPAQYPRIDLMPEFVWRIKDKAIYPFQFNA